MRKLIFLWIALIAVSLQAFADEKVSFSASAPDAVAVGDQFRLTYTVTTQKVRDFRAPSIKGFDVLMGPSRSQQSSVQIINGVSTSTSSITFTYILMATTEGSFTIPGATITADGNQMISNSVHVKVLPADQAGAAASSSGSSGAQQGSNASRASSGASVSNQDLFIAATASKTNVYEQEAFLLTYKIYTLVDLQRFDNVKLPDFKGFHSQEVELPNDRRWSLEHYKGRNYQTTIYRQFVLFPQQSGNLIIEPARFDASIAKATQVSDPFEAFFNGGSNYIEIKKTLTTPKLTIDVKPLPEGKPADFSGGVGEFSISSSINSTNVKTNDAITIKLVISGTGNLKLIGDPEIKFPDDFEVYDPKVDNKFRLTNAGLSGSKVIEYLAIPRNAGTFKIPAVKFSYFDIKSHSYKTLTTEEYELHVEKGEGNAAQTIANFTNKEDLKILNEDIRFIKQNDVTLSQKGDFFFDSMVYWLLYLVPGVVFIIFFIVYRKQIAANANVAKMRTKKANKVAVKRMKLAGKLLAENKKDVFYDEVLKALWGYISDKLNIPVSRLSKDNIEEELRKYGVEDALIKEFLVALNDCEFARFAPGDDNQAMDKVYSASLAVISKMENSIKH
ncbi:BatD family protein [Bacteroides oleiciplenus]|uniref:Protein BatD n=1 Tax=Bacteroides oleiciplenus TaxID=626931 RepID=A0A3E5BIC5_9BACE|nr:BatD family protein [Bacteroides oleiciplenus]RGN37352.1 protein BatD [Bacteroides oleiciplenus]